MKVSSTASPLTVCRQVSSSPLKCDVMSDNFNRTSCFFPELNITGRNKGGGVTFLFELTINIQTEELFKTFVIQTCVDDDMDW